MADDHGYLILGVALSLVCVLMCAVVIFCLWYYSRYRNYQMNITRMQIQQQAAARRARRQRQRPRRQPVDPQVAEKFSVARQIKQMFPMYRNQRTADIVNEIMDPEEPTNFDNAVVNAHVHGAHAQMANVDVAPGTTYSTTTEIVKTVAVGPDGVQHVVPSSSAPVPHPAQQQQQQRHYPQHPQQQALNLASGVPVGAAEEKSHQMVENVAQNAGNVVKTQQAWQKENGKRTHGLSEEMEREIMRTIKDFDWAHDRITYNPLVVIIPHAHYDASIIRNPDNPAETYEWKLQTIEGAELDAKCVEHIFGDIFGFEVFMEMERAKKGRGMVVKTAFTLEDYQGILEKVKNKILHKQGTAEKYDGLIFVHSGHGMTYKQQQVIFTQEGKMLRINQIADYFSDANCMALKERPRIFIFCHSRHRTFVKKYDPMHNFDFNGKLKWHFMQRMPGGNAMLSRMKRMKSWNNSPEKNAKRYEAAKQFIQWREQNLDGAVYWMNDKDRNWDMHKPDGVEMYIENYDPANSYENLLDNHPDFYVINAAAQDRGDYRFKAASGIGNYMLHSMREALIDHFEINKEISKRRDSYGLRLMCIRLSKWHELIGEKLHYLQTGWRQIHMHNRKPKNILFVRNPKRIRGDSIKKLKKHETLVVDLSESEKVMKNPLVVVAMIGEFNGAPTIKGRRQDYIETIKCFHEMFEYDVMYCVDEYRGRPSSTRLVSATEAHSFKKDLFKLKWSTLELKRFLGVEVCKVFVRKPDPKYDGLIIVLGSEGKKFKYNVFESHFYDSFGHAVALKSIRDTFRIIRAHDPNLEFQNVSKIFFFDINWVSKLDYVASEDAQIMHTQKFKKHIQQDFYDDIDPHNLQTEVEEPIEYNLFQCISNFEGEYARPSNDHQSKLIITMGKVLPTNLCTNGVNSVAACLHVLQSQCQKDWQEDNKARTCMLLECGEGSATWHT